jgi:VWFA-related protein
MNYYVRCMVLVLLSTVCLGQSGQTGATQAPRDADLIKIFFTVDNGHGVLVPDLAKDSFELREDGRPQTIQQISSSPGIPLTLGILLDTSGVMKNALPAEKGAAANFLDKVVTEKDLAFVMSFDVTVDLLQDLISDHSLLRSGLGQARVNIGTRSERSGGALNDAVYLAANEVLGKQVGRKALVILTSGIDQGSKVRLKDAIAAAQKADAVCYVVVFFRTIFGEPANELAEQTGGRLISVSSMDKLQQALNQIADQLRNQYTLSYVPDTNKHDGGFHAIEITSREGYKVHARKGYYASGSN